jgi:hypothetical protein
MILTPIHLEEMYLSMVLLENFMLFWVTQYTNLIAQNTRGGGRVRGDTMDASVTRRGRGADAGVVAPVVGSGMRSNTSTGVAQIFVACFAGRAATSSPTTGFCWQK